MPTFAYAGRTRSGETVTGERAADTMDAVVSALRREQVLVTLESAMSASSNKEELQEMINRGVGVVAGAGLGRPGAPPRTAIGR